MIIGEIEVIIKMGARYNIAPRQIVPAILNGGDGPRVVEMSWGWQPAWSKSLLINAQAETLLTKRSFEIPFREGRRCLIPADGFYEWTADKIPIRFTKPGNEPFCFAGLYLESKSKPLDVEVSQRKCIIITTEPNETVAKVHNRMPLIVQPDHYHWWLGDVMAETVLNHPDREELESCPVQPALNKVGAEGSELVRPFIRQQGELF